MKEFIERLKSKYKQIKPHFYLMNILIFIAKVVLFLITKSLSFLISSLYNLGIGLAKKKIYSNKDNYKSIGSFVIIASLCFIIYSIWIIITHKMVSYNLYIGITIATITFYDIGYSIYEIRKSIKNKNKQNNLLMSVNLATALISLQLTQSALLSFTQVGIDNSLYNGMIGIIVGLSSLTIGMSICLKNKK